MRSVSSMQRLVKVSFRLDPRSTGGIRGEHLWAEHVGKDRFRLRNTPVHARGYAYLDVVFAKPRRTGELVVSGVSLRGGHSTFWLRVTVEGEARFEGYWERLRLLGCGYEGAFELRAVDVPSTARLEDVYAVLDAGEADGVWTYELAHRGHLATRDG